MPKYITEKELDNYARVIAFGDNSFLELIILTIKEFNFVANKIESRIDFLQTNQNNYMVIRFVSDENSKLEAGCFWLIDGTTRDKHEAIQLFTQLKKPHSATIILDQSDFKTNEEVKSYIHSLFTLITKNFINGKKRKKIINSL